MINDVKIHRAEIEDVCDVVPLFCTYLQFYRRQASADAVESYLSARLQNHESVIYLARVDGKLAGFAQLYPSFASLSMSKNWILYDLYVDEDFRRNGVASRLLEQAKKLAEETGAAEIFLQTAKDNVAAQRLYERLGYVRDQEFYCYVLIVVRGP